MSIERNFFRRGITARLEKSGISGVKFKGWDRKYTPFKDGEKNHEYQNAIRELEQGSLLLKDVPDGVLSDIERDVFILAIEYSHDARFITRVMVQKGYSFDQFIIPGKNQTRPEMVRVLVEDALDKVISFTKEVEQHLFLSNKYHEFVKKF